jgi:Protein of unknown function (DUF3105)
MAIVSPSMRTAALVGVLVLVVSLAACGGSDKTSEPGEPTAAEPVPEDVEAPPAEPAEPAVETEPAAPANASCEEQQLADQGADHVGALPEGFEYNSVPATSGPHADTVIWNAYTEPLPDINVVHNLEHGGVAVQYGADVRAEQIAAITDWYAASPDAIVLAPRPELGGSVALTAWRHLLTCDGFDEASFTAFREAYRFNGPEAIPPDLLKQGM